jgi:hypothetical protein
MPYKDKNKRKEYHKTYGKEYRKNNKVEIRRRKTAWMRSNPEKVKAQSRRDMLKLLGWTLYEFDFAKKEQKKRCAICNGKPKEYLGPRYKLVPDHKHGVVPKPRGVLCSNCNLMLGLSKERPEVLRAAARYLENWSKKI